MVKTVMQGDELRTMRFAANMSQARLAEEIGMSRETVGAMERGAAPIEKRTELAVRYVCEKRKSAATETAAAIQGQGELATMNRNDLFAMLDARYAKK